MIETETKTWPETPAGGPLGDGRHAYATLRPESVEALCDNVREHVAQGRAIYPQGGATALNFGGVPRKPGVAIDTRSLAQVIDYPHADMTITVQAGITLTALREVLAEHGQRFLVDVPRPDRATLGGVFATNTSGPRRFGLGRPRDQIIGVSFVTSEGVEVKGGGRVVKNVAGYDFPRLLTGSLGTLGIITQMTVKVRPLPEASAVVWVPFASPDSLAGVLDSLNTSSTRPVALELLNPSCARTVGEHLGLPSNQWTIAIGLEDNVESVRWQIDRLMIELGRTDLQIREGADADGLWSALTEFQEAELGPVGCMANLRPSSVAGFARGLDPRRWAVQAHAGSGIVRMRSLGDWSLEQAAAEIDRFRSLAVRDGGNLTVGCCPTEWKERLRVWGEPRADWAVAERVKQALDPSKAMNPGRFVGGI